MAIERDWKQINRYRMLVSDLRYQKKRLREYCTRHVKTNASLRDEIRRLSNEISKLREVPIEFEELRKKYAKVGAKIQPSGKVRLREPA